MSEHGEHESHAGITAEIRARAGAWMDDKRRDAGRPKRKYDAKKRAPKLKRVEADA